MDKNVKVILGIIFAIVIIAAGYAVYKKQGQPASAKPFKIGAIPVLTGAGANLGEPFIKGLNLALEEINNKGGINGHQIKLAVQDGKLEGKTSVSAVQFLLNTEDPDIFIVMFGLPAQAISPILEKAQKPWVYEAYIRSPLDNPYAFKANFDSLTACGKLINYAKDNQKYKKLGVLMSKTEYNELCLEGIKKAESNISEYWYTYGDTDFRTLLLNAHSDNVDTLMITGTNDEYLNMFKQLSNFGYNIKIMCAAASECIFPDLIKSVSPNILNGILSIDFIPPDIDKTEFGKKYSNKYPNSSFTDYAWGADGYEEGLYISKAMKNCEPGDSKCLLESLKAVKDYGTVLSSSGFKDRVLQLNTKIMEFRDGKWKVLE